jgi:hypothetical protein
VVGGHFEGRHPPLPHTVGRRSGLSRLNPLVLQPTARASWPDVPGYEARTSRTFPVFGLAPVG